MESGDIFTRVEAQADLSRIMGHIVARRMSLAGHSEAGARFAFSPTSVDGTSLVGDLGTSSPISPNEMVSIVFQIEDESYFIRTRFLRVTLNMASLDFREPLFVLQRRQYSRVRATKIPGSKFQFVSINGAISGGSLPLVDLSGGGFSIDLIEGSFVMLQMGDVINGRIIIPSRADETVNGIVRHGRVQTSADGVVTHHFGVQFKDISSKQQQRALQIVFEIYREFADQTFKALENQG